MVRHHLGMQPTVFISFLLLIVRRMTGHTRCHDAGRDVVDGEAGAVAPFGRHLRMEDDLKQNVPGFLASCG